MTQTALQGVVEGVTTLCQGRLSAMHSAVSKVLTNAGISPSTISGLDDIFDPEGEFGRPFLGLETLHQQVKFYKTHFRFVEPVCVVLGERRVWTGSGVQRRSVVQEQTMMYVPILQTLQLLLLNEAVVAEIENGHKSQTEFLHDFCAGKVFSSHPLFSAHVDALQIFFYFDELEVCNPLGSKAKIHNLGIFYFMLGNLSPKFRSKLSVIQLIAIVEAPVMTSYGMDAVLRPFVDDVKKLEAGYEFDVHGTSKVLYGTVAAVSADNLGSFALGGFKESCSAQRCCRHCLTTREDSKKMFLEQQFQLRKCLELDSLLDKDQLCLLSLLKTTKSVVPLRPNGSNLMDLHTRKVLVSFMQSTGCLKLL